MAALGVTNPTLLDLAKATDPDGGIADIVEILAEQNEILDDMSWVEGNLTTGNRSEPVFLLRRGVKCMAEFNPIKERRRRLTMQQVC